MDKLIILNITFLRDGEEVIFHPAIIVGDKENIMIDCGYPGFLLILETEAQKNDFDFSKLTKIIVTHHDHDHIGALYEIKEKYPHIKIVSSTIEKPYIEGTKKSLRLLQTEKIFPNLAPELQEEALEFQKILESVKYVPVDITIDNDKEIDFLEDIDIIHTPGHMPGHISVYHKKSKTIITGDAMVAEDGILHMANPQYTLDLIRAKESIRQFLDYDVEQILCYHGGLITGDVKSIIKKLLK
ncbi:MAG: MBL fold metallo-hydrolase [Fusobacteriaceae bacterium]|jgi:glyoxylase-like metal-dependent hydrolase (beta-lactamase superfamily II)|nr:MBL fold metallo-hydrolase [Fusobacteriaceae bacterium]